MYGVRFGLLLIAQMTFYHEDTVARCIHKVVSCYFPGNFTTNSLFPEKLIHERSYSLSLGEKE